MDQGSLRTGKRAGSPGWAAQLLKEKGTAQAGGFLLIPPRPVLLQPRPWVRTAPGSLETGVLLPGVCGLEENSISLMRPSSPGQRGLQS